MPVWASPGLPSRSLLLSCHLHLFITAEAPHVTANYFPRLGCFLCVYFLFFPFFFFLHVSIFQLQHKTGNLLSGNAPDTVPDSASLFWRGRKKNGCRTTVQILTGQAGYWSAWLWRHCHVTFAFKWYYLVSCEWSGCQIWETSGSLIFSLLLKFSQRLREHFSLHLFPQQLITNDNSQNVCHSQRLMFKLKLAITRYCG